MEIRNIHLHYFDEIERILEPESCHIKTEKKCVGWKLSQDKLANNDWWFGVTKSKIIRDLRINFITPNWTKYTGFAPFYWEYPRITKISVNGCSEKLTLRMPNINNMPQVIDKTARNQYLNRLKMHRKSSDWLTTMFYEQSS